MPTEPSEPRIDAIPAGPFLGRRTQLAQLCRAVEESRRGRGDRLWIIGSPGVGKSRLLAEIARYAAWRDIPVERLDSALDFAPRPRGSGLLIVDPVLPDRVEYVDDALARAAGSGVLSIAAADSSGRDGVAAIPDDRSIPLEGLDAEDATRLLRAWLGTAFDPTWATSVVRSTCGHPGRMREAAMHRRKTRRSGDVTMMNSR